jgi:hypothetical protein
MMDFTYSEPLRRRVSMTAGFCPQCGRWFKSLEIHHAKGKCAKELRIIQKMVKPKK